MVKDSKVQVVTHGFIGSNESLNVSVTKTKIRKRRGKMLMIGLGEGGSFNFLKAVSQLSKGANSLLMDYILPNRNWDTNHVEVNPALTEIQSDMLSRFIKELADTGLMLKIKNGLYMLNPRAVFVSDKGADKADDEYDALVIRRKK
jgi:hypothetical protein